MANNKTVYVLTTEEGTTESFTTVGALNKFAGIRTTKAKIEAGEVANVTIQEESTEDVDAPVESVPEVFQVGGKVVVSGNATDEDLQGYVTENNDPTLTISDIDHTSGTITTEEYMNGIHFSDLLPVSEEQPTLDLGDNVEVILVGDAPKTPVSEPKEEVLTNESTSTEDSQEEDILDLTDEEHAAVVKQAEDEGSLPPAKELTNKDTTEGTEQLEYPEVGHFTDVKDIKKYIKGLSYEELAEWCELEGAEYKPHDNQSITRMRMAMAINALHFPNTAAKGGGSTKKKAKYADYSLEDLAQLAIDNDIEVKDSKGDPRIERMYLIMALKAAGLVPA